MDPNKISQVLLQKKCPACESHNTFEVPVPVLVSCPDVPNCRPIFRINGFCPTCQRTYVVPFLHPLHYFPQGPEDVLAQMVSCDEYQAQTNVSALKLKVSYNSKRDEAVTSLKTRRSKTVDVFPLEQGQEAVAVVRTTAKTVEEAGKQVVPPLVDSEKLIVLRENGQRYSAHTDELVRVSRALSKDYSVSVRFSEESAARAFLQICRTNGLSADILATLAERTNPFVDGDGLLATGTAALAVGKHFAVEDSFRKSLEDASFLDHSSEFVLETVDERLFVFRSADSDKAVYKAFAADTGELLFQIFQRTYVGEKLLRMLVGGNKTAFYYEKPGESAVAKIYNTDYIDKLDRAVPFAELELPAAVRAVRLCGETVLVQTARAVKVFRLTEQGTVFERMELVPKHEAACFEGNAHYVVFYTAGKEAEVFNIEGNYPRKVQTHFGSRDGVVPAAIRFVGAHHFECSSNKKLYEVYEIVKGETNLVYSGWPAENAVRVLYDPRNGFLFTLTDSFELEVYESHFGMTALRGKTALNEHYAKFVPPEKATSCVGQMLLLPVWNSDRRFSVLDPQNKLLNQVCLNIIHI